MNSTFSHNLGVVQADVVLAEAIGTDGHQYIIRPMHWNLANVEHYWKLFNEFRIFSDEVPKTLEGFERYVLSSGALWFEVWDDTDKANIGLMYVADFVASTIEPRFLSASMHVSMWDGKLSTRMPAMKLAIRELFLRFKLHRLEMQIPLFAGGAIRRAKRAGFVEEGVRRASRRYDGKWFGVLHLAMLEDEVP